MTSIPQHQNQYQIINSPCKKVITTQNFYDQLRQREFSYINLIKDLSQENKYLRSALNNLLKNNQTQNNVAIHQQILSLDRMESQYSPRVKEVNKRFQQINKNNNIFQPSYSSNDNIILKNISSSFNASQYNINRNNKEFQNVYPWNHIQKKISQQQNGAFSNIPLNRSLSQAQIRGSSVESRKFVGYQTRPIILLGDKQNISLKTSRQKHNQNLMIKNSRSIINLGGSNRSRLRSNQRTHSPTYFVEVQNMQPTYTTNSQSFKLKTEGNKNFSVSGLNSTFSNTGHFNNNFNQSISLQKSTSRSNTLINDISSPQRIKTKVLVQDNTSPFQNSIHQVQKTASPPLAFNKFRNPINTNNQLRQIVRCYPVVLGQVAESRYSVAPIINKEEYKIKNQSLKNNYEPPSITQKSIRQEIANNERLKSLVIIQNNKEQQNPYNHETTRNNQQKTTICKNIQESNYYTLKKLCLNQEKQQPLEDKSSFDDNIVSLDRNQNAIYENKFTSFQKEEFNKDESLKHYQTAQKQEQNIDMNQSSTARIKNSKEKINMKSNAINNIFQQENIVSNENFSSQFIIPKQKKKNNLNISNRIYL